MEKARRRRNAENKGIRRRGGRKPSFRRREKTIVGEGNCSRN